MAVLEQGAGQRCPARVPPTATQAGTSGEYAPYEFSPFSMMTKILAISFLFLYLGLFKDTKQCSNRHILSKMPRDRYYAPLCRMLKMPMISTYPRKIPPISFYTLNHITYLHTNRLISSIL